jgi:hypothetical protein
VAPLLLRGFRRRSWPPGSKVATVEWRGQQIDAVTHHHLEIPPTTTTQPQKKVLFSRIFCSLPWPCFNTI